MSALGAYGADLVNQKPRRVGLIGTGWYGKSDLWRLIQVAPLRPSPPGAERETGFLRHEFVFEKLVG